MAKAKAKGKSSGKTEAAADEAKKKKGKSKKNAAKEDSDDSKSAKKKADKAIKGEPTTAALVSNAANEQQSIQDSICRPNEYPGLLECPQTLAVAGSECGTYDSICKLLRAALRFSDRALILTSWGSFAVFRMNLEEQKSYFIYDGCTCNVNRLRYWDLNSGTAGLIYYNNLHDALVYIMEAREKYLKWRLIPKIPIEEICSN